MLDVEGALDYIRGDGDADDVGLTADEAANDVIVDLVRPAAEFVTVVASPTFGIVPPGVGSDAGALLAGDSFVVSGGYRLAEVTEDAMVLRANPAYWAGTPAIGEITVVTDLGGASGVDAFEEGELDYIGISEFDASWIAYDPVLGPQLREVPSLSTDFYGFDTSRPPFDDVRIRRAFAAAVDWRRIAFLAVSDPDAVATSMVPPGIPGRSDRDVLPDHDPESARALLADAGFPGGQGFPEVTLLTGGSPYDQAVVSEIKRELGVTLNSEVMDFGTYFDRLDNDPPQMWQLSWVADYPGRNDFLGVLLGDRVHEQLRPLELGRVRRRDRRGGRDHGRGRGSGRLRPRRGRRPARRAGHPDHLRHGLGAGPGRAARAPARTAWVRCASPGWRGASRDGADVADHGDARCAVGRRPGRSPSLAALRRADRRSP